MSWIFIIPVLVGIGFLAGSFVLFRRERLDPRNFAIAVVVSLLLVVSPGIYFILDAVKSLFGIVYTFVLAFGLAILLLITLVIYLVLVVGRLRDERDTLWQEVALMRSNIEELEANSGNPDKRTNDD